MAQYFEADTTAGWSLQTNPFEGVIAKTSSERAVAALRASAVMKP